MALKSSLIARGFSPFAAAAIAGDVTTSVAAAGSTQATATKLGTAITDISTCPTSAGVQVPAAMTNQGDGILIYNGGANTLSVYGLSGDAINAGSANAAYSVATHKACLIWRADSSHLRAILTA